MLSIVIVNWNSGPMLERCVRSVLPRGPDCETVVVDNHSEDGSLRFLREVEGRVRLVRNEGNAGFAAACNTGWRSSSGDFVLFLNPDTECRPGSLQSLEDTLVRDQRAWAVAGALTSLSGEVQVGFNVRRFPGLGSVAADMLLLEEIWPRNPWTRRYRMSDWLHDSVCEVDQPAAACLMLRRTALEQLGGFDERFFPAWFEDVDLCMRIRKSGGTILYQPAARFLHHGGSSLAGLSWEEFLKSYHCNMLRYFGKHYGREKADQVRRLLVIGMRLRALISLGLPRTPTDSRLDRWRMYRRVARHLSSFAEVRA